ncbi:MAG: translesion error-prone DNA polymerase V autoproteolytic subunit [bacterium]|nr:translesion error-prone DNA polymerase V autoproteolytic subunit [bacterium]
MKNMQEISILGLIEAGFPAPATEEVLDTMSLDEFLIEDKEASYLLKVKGDSMIEAGIMPGDFVIVEKGRQARVGDIVVALIDEEFTLKYLRIKNRKYYLESANKKYKDIIPKNELKIIAVVKAVVRKYA